MIVLPSKKPLCAISKNADIDHTVITQTLGYSFYLNPLRGSFQNYKRPLNCPCSQFIKTKIPVD